jgi:uncharacterized membrane protein YhhN
VPGALRAPVAAYVGIIALMASQAIGRALAKQEPLSLAVAAGACFFMVSDTLLAVNKFVLPDATIAALVLPTYYAAQALISMAVLGRPVRLESRARAGSDLATPDVRAATSSPP